jgi:hypothetical protein
MPMWILCSRPEGGGLPELNGFECDRCLVVVKGEAVAQAFELAPA